MMVMPSNNCKGLVHHLATKYPGSIGHLYSPGGQRGPCHWIPYALDNGAFGAFKNGVDFDLDAWISLCDWSKASGQAPLWCLIPDKVGDKRATLYQWSQLATRTRRRYGWPLAFAAQDGMTPNDVPADADVVFLGGSTEWKRQAIKPFCDSFPRVHVGRINTYKWVRYCADAGAESCDGTGWFRGDKKQLAGLVQFLREQAGEIEREQQEEIFA